MIENIYSELKIGDVGYVEKTITESDVYMYAGITGDFSWLHVNQKRAEQGHFKTRIVHGMLLVGLISTVVGNEMPGAGTIYEQQDIQFLKPCFINDTVRAQTEVLALLPAGRVKLRTSCYNQHNELIVDGTAIVIPPRQHVITEKIS
ncbi:HotDog domain [Syntrophomonas zehnderi OL-4]|uniref:HotDog domain n=1 Tax=Syntrophomonas zehnderi OL-4 TaxID=690567 RepID=A0A0E4GA51_9FIRM|nr:MaoC family dehydratase [Syntrophomonas zehnderi]CFX05587.1 HotDog domain [Syntrophomonas zehnderi OL-4]CFX34516.1 HotDog domain [Syntrophomonas zehnderi OL-4]